MPVTRCQIDPCALARDHERLSGKLKCADLERLASLAHLATGEARYDLSFAPDDHGRPVVRGTVGVHVEMICQRCLEPMELEVSSGVRLVGVRSDDDAKALDRRFEPLLLTDKGVSVVRLVEDELLLALPAAPTHAAGSGCELARRYRAPDGARPTPFADLTPLKRFDER